MKMGVVYSVTGATGKPGSNVVKIRVEDNQKVRALWRRNSISKLDPGVGPVIGDLHDPGPIKNTVDDEDRLVETGKENRGG